nr:helix-turn-helix domain-containing protein [Salinibacterium sp.]
MSTATMQTLTLDDIRDRATISIDETAAVLGVSRASAYASARSGDAFPVKRIGRRYLVPVPALLTWLAEN